MLNVKAEGLDQLHRQLEQLTDEIRVKAEAAVAEEVAETADDMRELAPKDSLELVESIVEEVDGLTGFAIAKARHAWVPEWGTSTHDQERYALPSAMRSQKRFPRRVRRKLRELS